MSRGILNWPQLLRQRQAVNGIRHAAGWHGFCFEEPVAAPVNFDEGNSASPVDKAMDG
jgi:hypothetical protein